MSYLAVKWIHILSPTVLFGTGIGSACYMLLTSLTREPRATALVVRRVVWADWLFTAPTVPSAAERAVSFASRGAVGRHALSARLALAVCDRDRLLEPVVRLQILMQRLAQRASDTGVTALPPACFACLRWWVALSAVAFLAFVAIFWPMVFRPS
jgi:uncharacterized membrane protein